MLPEYASQTRGTSESKERLRKNQCIYGRVLPDEVLTSSISYGEHSMKLAFIAKLPLLCRGQSTRLFYRDMCWSQSCAVWLRSGKSTGPNQPWKLKEWQYPTRGGPCPSENPLPGCSSQIRAMRGGLLLLQPWTFG